MSHVYGPVPSRRLGQSLGIDPIPLKTCNFNCVYCQLGRTTPLTNDRRDFYSVENILEEARIALDAHRPDDIDFVTIVGQGEPLLFASLGPLIRGLKRVSDTPVAVITNGSLIHLPDVRYELAQADVVLPTLDAPYEELFRRINRPWPGLHIADITEGLAAFRKMFGGRLWVEVMLVAGLNDREDTLFALRDELARIGPDSIHINVPVRPPAEPWVKIPADEDVLRATAILGEAAEIIAPYEGHFDLSGYPDVQDAVESIIRRHPIRERRLLETLARDLSEAGSPLAPERIVQILTQMESAGRARRRVYRGETFWQYGARR